MNEIIRLRVRVEGIDKADVITSEAGIATAKFVELPITLRGDELSIVEEDPTENELFSHENDDPEDYEIVGNGIRAKGSFIKASYAQMAELLGGKVVGTGDAAMFLKSAKKVAITGAFRFRLKGGGYIIIPNAKGFANFSANLGAEDGMLKIPFSLRALAQSGFDCGIIIKLSGTDAAAEGQAAGLKAGK